MPQVICRTQPSVTSPASSLDSGRGSAASTQSGGDGGGGASSSARSPSLIAPYPLQSETEEGWEQEGVSDALTYIVQHLTEELREVHKDPCCQFLQ